nr:hypothetical transcript [Hymenolepis microstoma]
MVPPVTETTGIDQFDNVRMGFRIMFYGGAAIMSLDLIIVAFCFKEEPKIAPSLAQHKKILQRRGVKNEESNADNEVSIHNAEECDLLQQSYFKQVLYCFKSVSFVFLNICYGVNTAVYYEIGTLLNIIVAAYFPVCLGLTE